MRLIAVGAVTGSGCLSQDDGDGEEGEEESDGGNGDIAPEDDERERDDAVVLGPEDDGSTVTVEQGDTVVVRLDENPSTGYEWRTETDDGIAVSESRYREPDGALGEGGAREITVEVTGNGSLRARYVRPWNDEIERTFTVTFRLA